MEELIRYMRAMVMLQLHTTQAVSASAEGLTFKPEVLLADAGFNSREIATMLEKTPAAVAKAISRARSARRSTAGVAETAAEGADNG